MNAIREVTYQVLQDVPTTRNNDILLIQKVLEKLDMPTDISKLAMVTNSNIMESITRTRRKCQAECPFLAANGEVSKKREAHERKMREEYGK